MTTNCTSSIGRARGRSHALQRVLLLVPGSMLLGGGCALAAGLFDRSSEPIGRVVFGLVLGLIASPAFVYAMWHPPRVRKAGFIVALNLLAAFIIGQVLGVGGALFVSGPAFLMICAAYGADGQRDAIEHARALNLCPACGYSLVGNESGLCPECGRAI